MKNFGFYLKNLIPIIFFIYNESPKNIYEISDELKKEILKRLNPFHETNSNDPIESFYLNPSYPLTFVPDIIPNTHIEIPVLYNPIVDTPLLECNNYLKLVIHSVLGKLTDEYSKKLNRLSLKMEEKKLGNESLGSFLSDVLWNSNGQDYYPFYYSMLKLERYRRVKDGKKSEKPQ